MVKGSSGRTASATLPFTANVAVQSSFACGLETGSLHTLLNWDQTESVPGLADLDQPGHGSLPEGRL